MPKVQMCSTKPKDDDTRVLLLNCWQCCVNTVLFWSKPSENFDNFTKLIVCSEKCITPRLGNFCLLNKPHEFKWAFLSF